MKGAQLTSVQSSNNYLTNIVVLTCRILSMLFMFGKSMIILANITSCVQVINIPATVD